MAKAPKHHLDRRAAELAADAESNSPDDLLNTMDTAAWLRVSVQWLEIGRCKGFGPKFIKLSARCVRYRRGDVVAWLRERSHLPNTRARLQDARA